MLSYLPERIQRWWNPPPIFTDADGDEEAYNERFFESEEALGEGEFGIVKVVRPLSSSSQDSKEDDDDDGNTERYAVKILPKGMTVRDNVLYHPMNPSVMQTEVGILRKLGGKRYSLKFLELYESPKSIYVITELCSGGSLMDYRSAVMELVGKSGKDAQVPFKVVSRVAYQLLDAVDHCAKNGVIHRDIKPSNIMLQRKININSSTSNNNTTEKEEKSIDFGDLRLIDFGSGALDNIEEREKDDAASSPESQKHTTYAGSPFYNSPEMFRRSYSYKTDVWSTGVTIYVFAAGFPPDEIMQNTFDTFHTSPKKIREEGKERNLKLLPNVPDDYPSSFYDMLERLLEYSPKKRVTAEEMLSCDFVVETVDD
mmetsp:Transcript_10737/g.14409  ORF Transcript_10737/g.14409 Transcript_10737/m.14409 type:complete len:370 (-) Transcript_10737:505-1614(-)